MTRLSEAERLLFQMMITTLFQKHSISPDDAMLILEGIIQDMYRVAAEKPELAKNAGVTFHQGTKQ